MKATALIARLQELVVKHGDVDVYRPGLHTAYDTAVLAAYYDPRLKVMRVDAKKVIREGIHIS